LLRTWGKHGQKVNGGVDNSTTTQALGSVALSGPKAVKEGERNFDLSKLRYSHHSALHTAKFC